MAHFHCAGSPVLHEQDNVTICQNQMCVYYQCQMLKMYLLQHQLQPLVLKPSSMKVFYDLDLQKQDSTKSYRSERKLASKKDNDQSLETWVFAYRKGDQLMIHQEDTHKPVFAVLLRSRSPRRKLDSGGVSETKGAPRSRQFMETLDRSTYIQI